MENKEIKIENNSKIDKDVLEVLNQPDILDALKDDVQIKRVILNCFCEMLSMFKDMKNTMTEFNQLISIVSADKLTEYFKEVNKNFQTEQTRANVQEKIKEGHKKSTKKAKSTKESV